MFDTIGALTSIIQYRPRQANPSQEGGYTVFFEWYISSCCLVDSHTSRRGSGPGLRKCPHDMRMQTMCGRMQVACCACKGGGEGAWYMVPYLRTKLRL